jgi:hypothetical protein
MTDLLSFVLPVVSVDEGAITHATACYARETLSDEHSLLTPISTDSLACAVQMLDESGVFGPVRVHVASDGGDAFCVYARLSDEHPQIGTPAMSMRDVDLNPFDSGQTMMLAVATYVAGTVNELREAFLTVSHPA